MKITLAWGRAPVVAAGISVSLVCAADTWYQEPIRLHAGDKQLDTAEWDTGGHAAPFLEDIDGDGRRDLVVGSIDGKFRLYLNAGTDAAPKFTAQSRWLMTPDAPAEVPNFCCVASGPQMVDIDGDGIVDLTSGSYAPGAIYWFKGLGGGNYAWRQMLVDGLGMPIFAHSESVYDESRCIESYVANIAWADWNADGRRDLIIGDLNGELFVRLQRATQDNGPTNPPIKGQPVFSPKHWQEREKKPSEIRIDDKSAIVSGHSAPTVADWDGDGLWDILVGSYKGGVYLLRNSGKAGAPEFRTREELFGPGVAMQWLEAGQMPTRGIRSQLHAVDYNRDGKMDLLLGDWSFTMTPRADLTSKERRKMKEVLNQLAALDREMGFDFSIDRTKSMAYWEKEEPTKKAEALEKQLQPYLTQYDRGGGNTTTYAAHGTIWVFLRK